jgi:hypothetical protein
MGKVGLRLSKGEKVWEHNSIELVGRLAFAPSKGLPPLSGTLFRLSYSDGFARCESRLGDLTSLS